VPAADTSRASIIIRAARPDDALLVRGFVQSSLASVAYADAAIASLDSALGHPGDEARALIALHDSHHAGVVVYGAIAGAEAAGRIRLIVVDAVARRRGLASALVQAALAALARDGMRVAFVELASDPALGATRSLLLRNGFHIDAAVADYYRDGVDLLILRRDLAAL